MKRQGIIQKMLWAQQMWVHTDTIECSCRILKTIIFQKENGLADVLSRHLITA